MARRNYLVEGLSGAGKSSVYDELIRRGYHAVSTDRAWKVPGDLDMHSLWDPQRALSELESTEPDVLFVCGSARNRDRFLPSFTKVFNLRIDDDTMRRRLAERTNNDFGKASDELELMLGLNAGGEKPAGAIDIDATRPLQDVVDDVLRLADRPAATPAPWSGRGRAGASSRVVDESALPTVHAVAGGEIEYAWSGDVLATLLSYLEGQGFDLAQDAAAARIVLTSAHRERYLARLDPSAFDGAALRRHYEERNETHAPRVGYALLDGIAFLRDTLARVEPGTVAVLTVGDEA
jgi:hypothetical protein